MTPRLALSLLTFALLGPAALAALFVSGGGMVPTGTPRPVVSTTAPAPADPIVTDPPRASRSLNRSTSPAPAVNRGPGPKVVRMVPPARRATVTDNRRAMWLRLMACEAPDRGWRYGAPGVGTDPGYSQFEGAFNWLNSTWLAHGGGQYAQHAYDATPAQQVAVAEETLRAEGVSAWPTCGPRTGLHR